MNEFKKMQKLAGLITESEYRKSLNEENNDYKISNYKKEALDTVDDFIEEFEPQDLFEFIPNLEDYNINPSTNSLDIEEFGSIYLIPNEGPIPDEVKKFMMDSNDGEINDNGPTWKKYPKNGYYYIVVA